MIYTALQNIVVTFAIIFCVFVTVINMYLSYMNTHHRRLAQDTEEAVHVMRNEIIRTVSDSVMPPMKDRGAVVSHLVTVSQSAVSVSRP